MTEKIMFYNEELAAKILETSRETINQMVSELIIVSDQSDQPIPNEELNSLVKALALTKESILASDMLNPNTRNRIHIKRRYSDE